MRKWALWLLPTLSVAVVLAAGGIYHVTTRSEQAPHPLLPAAGPARLLSEALAEEAGGADADTLPERPASLGGQLAVVVKAPLTPEQVHVSGEIQANQGLSELLRGHGFSRSETAQALAALTPLLDPRRLRAGQKYELWRSLDGHLDRLLLQESPLRKVEVVLEGGHFVGKQRLAEVKVEVARVLGTIESTLGAAVDQAGEKPKLANLLQDFLGSQVEFQSQSRRGDQFRVLVEKQLADGQFVRYGRILAADYRGSLVRIRAFAYTDEAGRTGVYDETGQSLERRFLYSPMPGHRVTSTFSPRRFHPIHKRWMPHNGTDYQASTGSPVLASGDGKVSVAETRGPNGLLVVVDHANGYRTHYAHLSRLARGVAPGQVVKRGQVLAYAGSTGTSTGPHLHYAVSLNGQFIDSRKLPRTRNSPLPQGQMKDYLTTIAPLNRDLDHMAMGTDALLGDLLISP